MAKELLVGNVAIAEAAIRAGCEAYFGYPITPQTEMLEYMAQRMPELGRTFVQAESEVAAINMVYGAACAGVRVMTSSSSPGISLMMEGISYIAAAEVPAVIVDIMRVGPGLGNITPSQGDYNQVAKGGGHGDYQPIVLAPATVQEMIDLTVEAFDLAEKYRTVVFVVADGFLGQMMEPVELPCMREICREEDRSKWAVTGAKGREPNVIIPYVYGLVGEEAFYQKQMQRLKEIEAKEVRYREMNMDGAEFAVVAFGTVGRIARSAVKKAQRAGIKVGLLRPISLYPFPFGRIYKLAQQVKSMLVVEMNGGQMVHDVRLAVAGKAETVFYGRMGGVVPSPREIFEQVEKLQGIEGPYA